MRKSIISLLQRIETQILKLLIQITKKQTQEINSDTQIVNRIDQNQNDNSKEKEITPIIIITNATENEVINKSKELSPETSHHINFTEDAGENIQLLDTKNQENVLEKILNLLESKHINNKNVEPNNKQQEKICKFYIL